MEFVQPSQTGITYARRRRTHAEEFATTRHAA